MLSIMRGFLPLLSRLIRNQSGYSLIQISIGILVVGLLTAPLVSLYLSYKENLKITSTYNNVQNIVTALQNYRTVSGEYPCPSPLNVPRDDDQYGHPRDCDPLGVIDTTAAGTCVEGVCIEQSIRTLPIPLSDPKIVVGAVPFRLLQMSEEDTIDGYGNRIVYAVTKSQTNNATFSDQLGGITVQDDTGASLSDPPGSVVFVVFSPGSNKNGAYDGNGVLIASCTGGKDAENCNSGFETGSFTPVDSVYTSAFQSDADGSEEYDDVLNFFTAQAEPVWRRTEDNFDDIADLSPQFVGIGTSEPATELEISSVSAAVPVDPLKVHGSGTGGRVMADRICDDDGLNCFDTETIAGTGTTACPSGQYVVGLANGDAVCGPISVECPDSMPVFKGLSGGNPVCGPLPGISCAAQSVNNCGGNDISLPLTTDTAITPYVNSTRPNTCLKARYRCNNGSFSLVDNALGSTCNFVPVSTTNGINCGLGYTGTFSSTITRTCNLNNIPVVTQVGSNTRGTTCFCVGGSSTQNLNCPAPQSGQYTRTTTLTPTANPNLCSTSITEDRSGCICSGTNGATRWVPNGSCASPFTNNPGGPPEKEQRYNGALNVCAWQDTGLTRNPCVCGVTSTTEQRDHACTDPVCEQSDPANKDLFQINYDPATCTPAGETLLTPGSCRPRSFRWQVDAAIGSGTADVDINSSCSCGEHTNNDVQLCADPAAPTSIYRCSCRP